MAEDVKYFTEQHKIVDPIVIGHSMGAKTAMMLALLYPDLVKFLVAVDNAPVDASISSDFPKYIRCMKEIERIGVSKQSEADQILKKEEESLAIRQFLLTNLIRDSKTSKMAFRIPLTTLARSLDYMGDFPLLPDQYTFKKPTLFIRGAFSKYVTDEMMPLIGRFFPRFQMKDVEAGHWVQAEKPEEFKQILSTFIQDEEENFKEQNEER